MATKERKIDKKHFDQHDFFRYYRKRRGSNVPKSAKDQLDDWYFTQGGVQKSLGDVVLSGLSKTDTKVVVELKDDEDGPRHLPGEYSVIQLLMKMKIMSGTTRVFQSILKGHHGHYVGFFLGISPVASEIAKEIGKNLASG